MYCNNVLNKDKMELSEVQNKVEAFKSDTDFFSRF